MARSRADGRPRTIEAYSTHARPCTNDCLSSGRLPPGRTLEQEGTMIPVLSRSRLVHFSARAVAGLIVAVACTGQQAAPTGAAPTATFGIGGLASVGVEGRTAVLYNGKISILDSRNTVVQAIALRDGRVLAMGTTDQVKNAAGSGAQLIDLGGRVVIPGLIDGTLHGVRNSSDCFLRDVRLDQVFTREQALSTYTQKAKGLPTGSWLYTWSGWNPNQLDQPGMLTKAELDKVLPDNPVMVQATGFSGIQVNSRALNALGITASSTDPGVAKDPKGQPTGQLSGTAAAAARQAMGAQLRAAAAADALSRSGNSQSTTTYTTHSHTSSVMLMLPSTCTRLVA